MKENEQLTAEEATGIRENASGLGPLYARGGAVLTDEQAYDTLREGEGVEVPNAGAGSWRKFFTAVGFKEPEEFETCSSAGDWTFIVRDGDEGDWYPAFQSNRYPRHGFRYSVDFNHGCESKELLLKVMCL